MSDSLKKCPHCGFKFKKNKKKITKKQKKIQKKAMTVLANYYTLQCKDKL